MWTLFVWYLSNLKHNHMLCLPRAADGAQTSTVPQTPAVHHHPPQPAAPQPRRSTALQPSLLPLLSTEEQPWKWGGRRRRRWRSSPPAAVRWPQSHALPQMPQPQPEVQLWPRHCTITTLQSAVHTVSLTCQFHFKLDSQVGWSKPVSLNDQ